MHLGLHAVHSARNVKLTRRFHGALYTHIEAFYSMCAMHGWQMDLYYAGHESPEMTWHQHILHAGLLAQLAECRFSNKAEIAEVRGSSPLQSIFGKVKVGAPLKPVCTIRKHGHCLLKIACCIHPASMGNACRRLPSKNPGSPSSV